MIILSEVGILHDPKRNMQKVKLAKKLKTNCCKKYKKDNRCKRCPCYDLLQQAS